MKHYNGLSGWISTKVRAPKPGTFAWKMNTAMTRMHVRLFQASGGRIGGTLDGAPLLVLHHTGAKTGARLQSRVLRALLPRGEEPTLIALDRAKMQVVATTSGQSCR